MSIFDRILGPVKKAFEESTIPMANPANFVSGALAGQAMDCRIPIGQFTNLYDSLSDGLKTKGLSGEQITQTLWANLTAVCPRCGCTISGQDLGDLWMAALWGSGGMLFVGSSGAASGRARFCQGLCPNGSCSSTEMKFSWRPAKPE